MSAGNLSEQNVEPSSSVGSVGNTVFLELLLFWKYRKIKTDFQRDSEVSLSTHRKLVGCSEISLDRTQLLSQRQFQIYDETTVFGIRCAYCSAIHPYNSLGNR